jgi:hypothetical protein
MPAVGLREHHQPLRIEVRLIQGDRLARVGSGSVAPAGAQRVTGGEHVQKRRPVVPRDRPCEERVRAGSRLKEQLAQQIIAKAFGL